MAKKFMMTATEVMDELGVSRAFAYKLMQKMNKELAEKGFNVGPINVEHSVILLFLDCNLVIVGPELHQGGFVTGLIYQITHAMFGTGDDQ